MLKSGVVFEPDSGGSDFGSCSSTPAKAFHHSVGIVKRPFEVVNFTRHEGRSAVIDPDWVRIIVKTDEVLPL